MADKRTRLKFENLPPNMTEGKLKTIFTNRKRRGGGTIDQIDLDNDTSSAVITFHEREAVEIILGRGNVIDIDGYEVHISQSDDRFANPTRRNQMGSNDFEVAEESDDSSELTPVSQSIRQRSSESRQAGHRSCLMSSTKADDDEASPEESFFETKGATSNRNASSSSVKHYADKKTKYQSSRQPESASSSECSENEECKFQNSYAEEYTLLEGLTPLERAERTVKIKIIDVKKSRDFYILYLEDDSVNEGPFFECSIMQDALRKQLFVTFKEPKDARAFRRINFGANSNISEATNASVEELNWHSNLVAVFGYCFQSSKEKDKLKQHVSKILETDVLEILQYNDARTFIIKFDPRHCQQAKLADMVWKCAFQFLGVQLLTAPVEKNNQILISGLSSSTDDETVERYLSNKRHGGMPGQLILPIARISTQQVVATFKSEEAIERILARRDHKLEGGNLKIDYFHHCLTKEFFEKRFNCYRDAITKVSKKAKSKNKPEHAPRAVDDELGAESSTQNKRQNIAKMRKSSPRGEHQIQQVMWKNKVCRDEESLLPVAMKALSKRDKYHRDANAQKKSKEIIKKPLPLKEHEKEMLQRLDFFKGLNVKTEFDNEHAILIGTRENINDAVSKILTEGLIHIQKTVLTDKIVDPTKLDFLKNKKVQTFMNKKFEKENLPAFIKSKDDYIILHNFDQAKTEIMIEILMKQIKCKTLSYDQKFALIQSPKGMQLIEHLCGIGEEKVAAVKLEPVTKSIQIVALKKHFDNLLESIEQFMAENHIVKEEFPFSRAELEYIETFYSREYERFLDNMKRQGISVNYSADKVVLEGQQDGIHEGKMALFSLKDEIKSHQFKVIKFGIKEFLSEKAGKIFIEDFEKLNECVIKMSTSATPRSLGKSTGHIPISSAAKDVAYCILKNCEIWFTQGDILDMITDAIINTLNVSLKFDDSLGKAIIARGGAKIEEELKKWPLSSGVKITSAGELINIKKIIHLVTSNSPESIDGIKEKLHSCLDEAEKCHLKTLAIPFKYISRMLDIGSKSLQEALLHVIMEFLDEDYLVLNKLILCDVKGKTVEDIIKRCESIWNVKVEKLNSKEAVNDQLKHHQRDYTAEENVSMAKSQVCDREPKYEISKFGSIQLDIKIGEITRAKTDCIVVTVNESLDLKKGTIGKDVLMYGGASIQEELNNNYKFGILAGDFAVSKAGNLECHHILHACLTGYKGEKSTLSSLVFKLLTRANALNAKSISIPALGTGGLKYPARESALAIQDGIRKFTRNYRHTSLTKIKLIIFKDPETEKVFRSVFCTETSDDPEDNEMTHMRFAAASGEDKFKSGGDKKFTFGSVTLTVKCGDITEERCDAIVNGIKENMDLSSYGAVCKSILEKCGPSFQEECISKMQDIRRVGVTMTSGGKLPCRKLIHLNMDKFANNLDTGLYQVLQLAELNRCRSLAVPALGTGRKGADIHKIKRMIYEAIEKFGAADRILSDIRLVVYKRNMVSDFIVESPKEEGVVLPGNEQTSLQISKNADLIIVSKKDKEEKVLIQKFTKGIDAIIAKKSTPFKNLNTLTEQQVETLKDFGLRHRILVKIDVDKGCIHFEGLKNNFTDIHNCVYELLLDRPQRSKNAEIQWQFRSRGQWRKFEPIINATLEREHTKHSPLVTIQDFRGRSYSVDFAKKLEFLVDRHGSIITDKSYRIRRKDETHSSDSSDSDED